MCLIWTQTHQTLPIPAVRLETDHAKCLGFPDHRPAIARYSVLFVPDERLLPHHADHGGVEQVEGEELTRHQGQAGLVQERQTEDVIILQQDVKLVSQSP